VKEQKVKIMIGKRGFELQKISKNERGKYP